MVCLNQLPTRSSFQSTTDSWKHLTLTFDRSSRVHRSVRAYLHMILVKMCNHRFLG